MMSSRNGSKDAKAGNCARGSPKIADIRWFASPSFGPILRASNRHAAKKNTANPPMMSSKVKSIPAVTGIRKMLNPVASSVSTRTAATANIEALSTARPTAIKSTMRIAGQRMNPTASSRKIGRSMSTRESGGKSWLHQVGAAAGCLRSSNKGNTVCSAANTRYMASAHGSSAAVRCPVVQTDSSPKTVRPATR